MKKLRVTFEDLWLTFAGLCRYLSLLRRTQYLDSTGRSRYTQEKLFQLLNHCNQNIPYYQAAFRQYGVDLDSEDLVVELKKLPILSKQYVIDNIDKFVVPLGAKTGLRFSTSGSTGRPFSILTSKNQWITEQGIIWRSWFWAGYRIFDKVAIFRSYSPALGEPLIKLNRLFNWKYFSVYHMSDEDLESYVRDLIEWKPRFLRGYPSSILILCKFLKERALRLEGLKGVLTASEALSSDSRQFIENVLGVRVFDHYGQAEITAMFHNCSRSSRMHVDFEYGFVELVNSEESDNNQRRIVATNLENFHTPLLRYDTGDLAVGDFERCDCTNCDLTSPTVSKIIGRASQYIYSSSRGAIPATNIFTFFSKLECVIQFQIRQVEIDEVQLALSIENRRNDSVQKICSELAKLLELRVVYVENFTMKGEGKINPIIQEIRDEI